MTYKPKQHEQNGISWKAKTLYVDIDTGEKLYPKVIRTHTIITYRKIEYIKIKTTKHVTINNSKGNIEYTTQCTRQPQQKINFID